MEVLQALQGNKYCDINDINKQLLDCASSNKLDECMVLLKAKANVNYENRTGWTVCHEAIYGKEDCTDIVEILIQFKVDVNIVSRTGWPVLHMCAFYGYIKCAKLLLEAKANCHSKTNNGESCIDIARAYNQHKMVLLLQEYM